MCMVILLHSHVSMFKHSYRTENSEEISAFKFYLALLKNKVTLRRMQKFKLVSVLKDLFKGQQNTVLTFDKTQRNTAITTDPQT